ncbi:hypothetical protein BASA83_007394 [Batrachochytrium salamandrivorans]|nr:hypothetical protein BASA83_007394 [Batrachochytrium salamandrivorans]
MVCHIPHVCCGDITGAKAASIRSVGRRFDTEEPLLMGYIVQGTSPSLAKSSASRDVLSARSKVDPHATTIQYVRQTIHKPGNDNVGVLTMLKKLNSNQTPSRYDTTCSVMRLFCYRRGDYKQHLQHVSEFISQGHSMTPARFIHYS